MLTYYSMQSFRIVQPFICKLFLQLNTKSFNVKINNRKVVSTSVAIAVLGKLAIDVLTALITSEFGVLLYKGLASNGTKYELSGTVSMVLIVLKKLLVCILFYVRCYLFNYWW